MKKIFSGILFSMMALGLWAVPARHITKTLTLQDGTQVENAVLSGDEFFHYWLAPDGTRYQALNDSVWEAIPTEQAAQAIRRACTKKQAVSAKRTHSVNAAPRGLLILVNFSNLSFQSSNTQAQMDSMLNGQNYTYDQAIGSARQYFIDQSGGTYKPQFDVVGPVTLDNTYAYYGGNGSGDEGEDCKLGDFVLQACQKADAAGVDFTQYDNDNDGYVDFVYLIYAGYGEADGGSANTLWPASWDMESAIAGGYTSLSTRATASSYTFDGKTLGSFAYSNELNYYTSYHNERGFSSSNPKRCGIGTFCHEFSHVIGLRDYYDTQYGNNYNNNLTPGYWSLMDAGSYNMDGDVPPNYSIFDKYYVGWATPTLLNAEQDVTLPADHFTGYYITSNGTTATPETTSFVYYLENRQQSGWDEDLPGHGMLVWKIKYNEQDWTNNQLNNTSGNPEYTYVPADGKYSDAQGDSGDTYPGTSNKTSCTLYSAYPITNIAENSGVITFHCNVGSSGSEESGDNDDDPTTDTIPDDPCSRFKWTAIQKLSTGEQLLGWYTWNITLTDATYLGYEAQRGAQFGSKSAPVQQASLTTSNPADCLINTVTVNAAMGSKGDATLAIYIGGTQVGSAKSLSGASANYSFTNTAHLQGNLEIRLTNSQKAIYLKSILITFDSGEQDVALEETEQPVNSRKYIENGRLIIEVGGEKYDIMGRKL